VWADVPARSVEHEILNFFYLPKLVLTMKKVILIALEILGVVLTYLGKKRSASKREVESGQEASGDAED
jgi:mannose/fructose/N-acetylgalactosamine-specific phosphotransferase system component IIC